MKYIKANVVKLTWNVLLKNKNKHIFSLIMHNKHIVLETISAGFECGKKTKPYLSHFLKIQLRKSMEPVANLTDIEKLDLETTRQKEGCRLVM